MHKFRSNIHLKSTISVFLCQWSPMLKSILKFLSQILWNDNISNANQIAIALCTAYAIMKLFRVVISFSVAICPSMIPLLLFLFFFYSKVCIYYEGVACDKWQVAFSRSEWQERALPFWILNKDKKWVLLSLSRELVRSPLNTTKTLKIWVWAMQHADSMSFWTFYYSIVRFTQFLPWCHGRCGIVYFVMIIFSFF